MAFLQVSGISTVSDLFSIKKIFEEKGVAGRVSCKAESYSGDRGKIKVLYEGSPAKIKGIFQQIKRVIRKEHNHLNLFLSGV